MNVDVKPEAKSYDAYNFSAVDSILYVNVRKQKVSLCKSRLFIQFLTNRIL